MQVNGLRDADWISRSTSIWQDYCDTETRRGSVPMIGPGKAKGSMNTSIGSVANMNQKTRNMNAVLGRV
jgi:hypothetical protein